MPLAAPKPCTSPGCRRLVPWGRDCPDHPRNWHKQEKRGTRHERGYGSAWDRLRDQVMLRDKGLCQPCSHAGRIFPASEVDHIVPKSQGGTDDSANLQAICSPCHKVKTAMESRGDAASLRPEWLPAPLIPVTIICGPPGSGKTFLANQLSKNTPPPSHRVPPPSISGPPGDDRNLAGRAFSDAESGLDHSLCGIHDVSTGNGPSPTSSSDTTHDAWGPGRVKDRDGYSSEAGSVLVIDTDEIAAKQTGLPMHHANKEERINAIRARNSLLASLSQKTATPHWKSAIVTMIGSGVDNRTWWKQKLNAELIVMQTPKDLCVQRVQARDIPLVRRLEQLNLISSWK